MAAVSDPSATASEALLAALRDPACYPHPARRVRMLTTHLSWVLLAGRYAYKLKRPVRLGFLDYSTLARRRRACAAEVRLNAAPAPLLLLVTGLARTGKTALAERLAAWLGWPAFHSDRVRKALAGLAPTAHRPAAFETGLYDPDTTNRTYEALLAAAEGVLRQGRSVILDAAFLERARRDLARARAAALGAEAAIVVCSAPEAVVVQRLAARAADPARESDADWAIYRAQQHRFERVAADEAPSLVLATDQPLARGPARLPLARPAWLSAHSVTGPPRQRWGRGGRRSGTVHADGAAVPALFGRSGVGCARVGRRANQSRCGHGGHGGREDGDWDADHDRAGDTDH